ncbi:MAG: hypothetical protein ACK4GU_16375, partial [Alishewanella aestuarii]
FTSSALYKHQPNSCKNKQQTSTRPSKDYPKKIWTKFESENFKHRFGENSVIPIWYQDNPPGMFDESRKYGGLSFDPAGDLSTETEAIASALAQMMEEVRAEDKGKNDC